MPEPMFLWVAVFDVKDPLRRRKIREILAFRGGEVRKGVYEFTSTATGLKRATEEASMILAPEDIMRVYRVCADCRPRCVLFGEGELDHPTCAIIV